MIDYKKFLTDERIKEIKGMTNTNIIFEVKFLGCTNNLGDRIKIKNRNTGEAVVIDYSYSLPSDIMIQALLYIGACGYEIKGLSDNMIIVNWDCSKNLIL